MYFFLYYAVKKLITLIITKSIKTVLKLLVCVFEYKIDNYNKIRKNKYQNASNINMFQTEL